MEVNFTFPDGRLSQKESIRAASLADIPEPASNEDGHAAITAKPASTLDLSARSRPSLPEDKIRLCLDFGTAMSKAWACGSSEKQTFPLVLGRPADGIDVLAAPSSFFISKTGYRILVLQPNANTSWNSSRPAAF